MPRLKKVKQFDRAECGRVRGEVQKAMTELGAKLGINITIGNGRFSSDSFGMKIDCSLGADNLQSLAEQMQKEFGRHASQFGLKGSDFGKSFSDYRGKRWKITGIKPRSHRYPILCENTNGKTFKLPADEVSRGLESEA